MVTPTDVAQFTKEMDEACSDWQFHSYGHTKHAFTNPLANDETLGTVYHPVMARRAWLLMESFLNELF